MISRWLLILQRLSRRLWVRVALIALGSLLALAIAPLLSRFLPEGISDQFADNAVLPVLTILASGMLVVTTFSLNVMVSAYRTAATTATPRVYRLLLEDTITQSVLATFVGGFIYALSAVILFRAGVYTSQAKIALFAITIGIVALIVAAILRWIDHLATLGSMDHTLRLIEDRSRTALRQRATLPCLGGRCASDDDLTHQAAAGIVANKSGFLRFIDISRLNRISKKAKSHIRIRIAPGQFVLRGQTLAEAIPGNEDLCRAAARHFEIGDVRSFDQDPAFGLTLLAETAQRALSPGVNDPGTAIEVLGRLERLLWEEAPNEVSGTVTRTPDFGYVTVKPVTARYLLDCAVAPIARDGADDPDVIGRVFEMLTNFADHRNAAVRDAAGELAADLKNARRKR